MRILVAPDKFKGTLTAVEAAGSLCSHLRRVLPGVRCMPCPVADGGEGTLATLRPALRLVLRWTRVLDPLGRVLRAPFGLAPDGRLAVVEMARASGLGLLSPRERDPLRASTYGTGLLLLGAARAGARRILVALGGSATVDGGLGLLQALGARITASRPLPRPAGGQHLPSVRSVDLRPARERLGRARLAGLCDVMLPLLGPRGSRLFSPQKGATRSDVPRLEAGLAHFERVLSASCGRDLRDRPGTGAAGGLGLSLLALGGTLEPGFDRVARLLHFEGKVRACDVVVTGEGRLDRGSRGGKAPIGVARAARAAGRPCHVVCGSAEDGLAWTRREGIHGVFPLFRERRSPGEVRGEGTEKKMGEAVQRLAHRLERSRPADGLKSRP
jgi:glycerate kinase